MKTLIIPAVLLLSATAMATPEVTYKTLITCQQDDGDQWIEVGIGRNHLGLEIFVVEHDEDDGRARLLENTQVKKTTKGGKTVYMDKFQTLRLTVEATKRKALFEMIEKGRYPGLLCYENSDITYEIPLELEPVAE